MTSIDRDIGEIKGAIKDMSGRMRRMDANIELVRDAHQQNGRSIAEMGERCRIHGRQLSDVYEKIGSIREDTEVVRVREMAEQKTRGSMKWVINTLISIAAIVVTVFLTLFFSGG